MSSITSKKYLLFVFAIFLIAFFSFTFSMANRSHQIILTGETMGTTYHIKYFPGNKTPHQNFIQDNLNKILQEVNQEMSTYIKDSEISRFNNLRSTDWVPISYDFAYVVKSALDVANKTNGAYDITVGPLVDLWGFGAKSDDEYYIPTQKEISRLQKKVGYKKLQIRLTTPTSTTSSIKKLNPELEIDLSSIAKGFGVDKLAHYLEQKDIHHYLVEIGGEIRTSGKGWKVGIETPIPESSTIQKTILLEDQSLATSGDYRNFFAINGKSYSHTIDPRTGWPVSHNIASISIIDNECMLADAWATAINVLGLIEGKKLITKYHLKSLLMDREEILFSGFLGSNISNAHIKPIF